MRNPVLKKKDKLLLVFKLQYAPTEYKEALFSKLVEFEEDFYKKLGENNDVNDNFKKLLFGFLKANYKDANSKKRAFESISFYKPIK